MTTTHTSKFLLLCAALLFCCSYVSAYKFLVILPTSARSHYNVGSALVKGLVDKGHDVTVVSPFKNKNAPKNWHDIYTPKIIEVMDERKKMIIKQVERSVIQNVISIYDMGISLTSIILSEPDVQKLIQSKQTFDAVIVEVFVSEALFGFSEHFNAPLIGLGTFGAISWNTDMVGSPSPPSYVPHAFLPFTDHMTLAQRVGNLAITTFERLLLDFHYLPRQAALYKQHFPHLTRSLNDIRKNTALVLLNQHVSLSTPRPYMPNMVEVGGMHINRKSKPLPAHLEKFLNESEHGVIYFSMGSNLQSRTLPLEKRQEILKTLSGLKQRVLWKFEEPTLEGKPDNVFISDWFPQDDILAHPKVVAFITHGGLLSTTESIYHGKPVIGMPMFGDQFLNMARAELNGYGAVVDYKTLSSEKFTAAIQRVTGSPSYAEKARFMSERYRDQPIEPRDLAVFWVEHVARHKGAKYLHCGGLDLNFLQYHNIDAIVILYGGLALVPVFLILLLRFVVRKVFGGKSKQSKKVKRN